LQNIELLTLPSNVIRPFRIQQRLLLSRIESMPFRNMLLGVGDFIEMIRDFLL